MKLFRKWMTPYMPESAWKLLGMYLAVMNYRLLEQGSQKSTMPKIMGAIVTLYLVQHEKWIRQEFYRVRASIWANGTIHKYFDADQLDAIEAASAAEISHAVRTSRPRKRRSAA